MEGQGPSAYRVEKPRPNSRMKNRDDPTWQRSGTVFDNGGYVTYPGVMKNNGWSGGQNRNGNNRNRNNKNVTGEETGEATSNSNRRSNT